MASKVFNKTELALLGFAKRNDGLVVVEWGYGQGPKGGPVSFGRRKLKAFRSLVSRGLVHEGGGHKSTTYTNGYAVHVLSRHGQLITTED